MQKVPVIFRKFNDGEIIALFPSLPCDLRESGCRSFTSKGRDSYIDTSIVRVTKEATADEFIPLLVDLVKAGYDPEVKQRVTAQLNEERVRAYRMLKETKRSFMRPMNRPMAQVGEDADEHDLIDNQAA